jgi:c-di-GMP-binding flagellar brake protein YcgR
MSIPEQQRREHPRIKVKVPVEILVEGTESPLRGATSDLSVSGCYVETIFPLAIGTALDLKLQVGGTLLVMAKVVTCDPQVGNGIQFTEMLPEDVEELRTFIEAHERETAD